MPTSPIDSNWDTPMALPQNMKLLMDGTEVSQPEKWKQQLIIKEYAET